MLSYKLNSLCEIIIGPMSYTENPHPHQSEKLEFLSPNYVAYQAGENGKIIFGVIKFIKGRWKISYQHKLPAFGGYISSERNIFGSPTYCPNATSHHKKHLEIYDTMPHLVFFDSEETALRAGFHKCKVCTK